MSHDQLLGLLTAASKVEPYILQPRALNHPDIAAITDTALCTVRTFTFRAPNRPPEYLDGYLKFPTGNGVTDNTHQGGIASPVDKKTGMLRRAVSGDPISAEFSHHPDAGAEMSGMQVPYWDQVVDLSLNAHRALSTNPVLGWDIAVTPGGPIVVEGNAAPDVETFQRVTGRPIGESRLPEAMVEHFNLRERAGKERRLASAT